MNNNIDAGRSSFFPNSKVAKEQQAQKLRKSQLLRNTDVRSKEITAKTKNDVKLGISDAVKDFSMIKKAVDKAPEMNNSKKIAELRSKIQNGTYKVDYDALADKMLEREY